MPYRNAVSVLPDPVGAWIRTCPLDAIAGHPRSCGGVGASKVPSNHARVAGEKTLSGSTRTSVALGRRPTCDESVPFHRRGGLRDTGAAPAVRLALVEFGPRTTTT